MLLAWILAGLCLSGVATAATLTVVVSNVQSSIGRLNIAVYDNGKDWLGDNVVEGQSVIVADHLDGDQISVQFELGPGEYAVSVHHDDNDNGKMDSNFIGIPREPTGLSNGHVPRFGPPKYKKARFTLGAEGLEMPITLSD